MTVEAADVVISGAEPKANGLVGQVIRQLDMRGLYHACAASIMHSGATRVRCGPPTAERSRAWRYCLSVTTGLPTAPSSRFPIEPDRPLVGTTEYERYSVGERVPMHSQAQLALCAPGPEVELLHDARSILIDATAGAVSAVARPWSDRVDIVAEELAVEIPVAQRFQGSGRAARIAEMDILAIMGVRPASRECSP